MSGTKGDNQDTEDETQKIHEEANGEKEVTESKAEKDEDITEEIIYNIDPEMVEKLSVGVLGHCLPDLQKAKSSLDEILQNQNILMETVQRENGKFTDCKAMGDVTEMMVKSRKYYTKLVNLKKEMAVLSERSFKLKKRAVKLQQQKQKEELMKAQQLERELEKERMLTAKVAKKSETSHVT